MITPTADSLSSTGGSDPHEPRRGTQVPRWALAALGVFGGECVTGYLHPALTAALAVADLVVGVSLAVLVIAVALFGHEDRCDRLYRLLRWLFNRPEPPAPSR